MTATPGAARTPRHWSRYVALGDSFTEGMSDVDPDNPYRYVGWADRLAARLAQRAGKQGSTFAYANLAVRGKLLQDIAGRQVDDALALQPDLASIVGGGNDILRPRADVDALAGSLDLAVGRLRAAGADVLMATPVDPRDAPVIRHTRGRAGAYTAHIWAIARRHDAYVVDLWTMAALRDWRLWADDRIHLTSEGHRRVALNAWTTLGLAESGDGAGSGDPDWARPLPPAPPLTRAAVARANAVWARQYVGPWVQRRLQGRSSGDALTAKRPDLEPL